MALNVFCYIYFSCSGFLLQSNLASYFFYLFYFCQFIRWIANINFTVMKAVAQGQNMNNKKSKHSFLPYWFIYYDLFFCILLLTRSPFRGFIPLVLVSSFSLQGRDVWHFRFASTSCTSFNLPRQSSSSGLRNSHVSQLKLFVRIEFYFLLY